MVCFTKVCWLTGFKILCVKAYFKLYLVLNWKPIKFLELGGGGGGAIQEYLEE